ncbi:MAG: HEPN domain-containing protein [Nitrosopumilaceae archaeon]|nr:HEPN domain-containing protein [Nitrosopumilaceae archaeon]NIV64740.1 HEPN domain-containing protein [Nitrosopumilaceae archaeon]NIX61302.1 HEPN domain-containing protein [Nitrosopumilaceae archaeon]
MTPEQKALLKKAEDSYEAAKILAQEGYFDFAVSRAYYAMFYIAEAFLLEKNLSFSKHSAVISAFGQHFAKTKQLPQEYHRFLIEGQNSRNLGDYDSVPAFTDSDAEEQIKRAGKFIKLAKKSIK